jgi:hypothetical protein
MLWIIWIMRKKKETPRPLRKKREMERDGEGEIGWEGKDEKMLTPTYAMT